MNQQTTLRQFYRSIDDYVPGGIVEATGNVQYNPRTGYKAIEVRYPVAAGHFKYKWMSPYGLIPCESPEKWLDEDAGDLKLFALIQDHGGLLPQIDPLPFDDINTSEVLHRIIGDLKLLEGLTIGGSPERLDLFEQMIDTLLADDRIVTAIRMKQHPEEYE